MVLSPTSKPFRLSSRASLRDVLRVHFNPVIGSPAVTSCNSFSNAFSIPGCFFQPASALLLVAVSLKLDFASDVPLHPALDKCIPTQTCNLRQLRNISFLTCQNANKTSFVSFVQAHQNTVDCFVFLRYSTIWMQHTNFTSTLMKRFRRFARHSACPYCIFFDKLIIFRKCSSYFCAKPKISKDKNQGDGGFTNTRFLIKPTIFPTRYRIVSIHPVRPE